MLAYLGAQFIETVYRLECKAQERVNVQCRKIEVTAYTPDLAQCDADPWIAASGRYPEVGTVAVSRDLFWRGWTFGRKVYLEGLGIYTINDLMARKWSARIDIVFPYSQKHWAINFGRRKAVKAILLPQEDEYKKTFKKDNKVAVPQTAKVGEK